MADHEARALQNEEAVGRALGRRRAALAGHTGDEATARELLGDSDEGVRMAALGALVRLGTLTGGDVDTALGDPSPAVRRRICELASSLPPTDFGRLLGDDDPAVVEAACFAAGEQRDAGAVKALARVAGGHPHHLCRESAVAALGAIGELAGLPAILAAFGDKPAVRRRAVIALAPFEGPEVDAALHRALEDRDRQVRQAAEDLIGRTSDERA